MTIEESIERLKFDMAMCKFDPWTGEEEFTNDDSRSGYEADKVAICALEKQIPKKPTMYDSVPHARCPECHNAVMVYCDGAKQPYCHWCGQAIDWSEKDDP